MRALIVALTLTACSTPNTPTALSNACGYDTDAMLALDERSFDRTDGSGWRAVADTEGCEAAAADLIARYRASHPDVADATGLLHHEAQMRAASGQTDAAIALIEQTRALETAPEMLAYRDAELAFLRNDREALLAARSRLVDVPAPENFTASVARFRERYPNATPPTWPLNLEVVDGFVSCFGRPYHEAYVAPCRGSAVSD